ncbi:hypothetical protein [Flaviaesturariibacter terrae]
MEDVLVKKAFPEMVQPEWPGTIHRLIFVAANPMKRILPALAPLLLLSIFGCTDFVALNERILDAQREAAYHSPYKSAGGATGYAEAQAPMRASLPRRLRDRMHLRGLGADTLWMIESFDASCIFCPADYIRVLYRDSMYTLQHRGNEWIPKNYDLEVRPFPRPSSTFDDRLRYDNLEELSEKVRQGQDWRANPLQYGADDCNDGDYTFLSVVYPDGRVEALFVRCLMPRIYRKH